MRKFFVKEANTSLAEEYTVLCSEKRVKLYTVCLNVKLQYYERFYNIQTKEFNKNDVYIPFKRIKS